MSTSDEKLDKQEAIHCLNAALTLQYRSALQYSIVASSLIGIKALALGPKLTEFGDEELGGVNALIEKIISFRGAPTTEVAELHFDPKAKDALRWLIECEEELIDKLVDFLSRALRS